MTDVQLKLVKRTEEGVFGRAINNLNRMLYSPSGSFFNLAINSKRNNVVKNFLLTDDVAKATNEKKRTQMINKYEKVFDSYLNMLESYITETIYNKAKKKVSSIKENKVLSNYYEVVALKSTDFVEYKYRRQTLLLEMDWDIILSTKSDAFVEKYKKFYLSVVSQLYKSLMRHYAINLTDATKDKQQTYTHIYNLIEDYIKVVLPYEEENEINKGIIDIYKNQIAIIDDYNKKSYSEIKKNMLLLELSKSIFAYSFPMIAMDQCYVELINSSRIALMNTFLDADKFEVYQLLLDLMESYNINVLSKKIYWDTDLEKEEYKRFWDKYLEFKKLERIDYDEYIRLREVHFIMDDLQKIKGDKNLEEVRKYYRERMRQQKGFRVLKNSVSIKSGIWRTRRRMKADEGV